MALALSACNNNSDKQKTQQADQPPVSHVHHPKWSKNANIYEVNMRQYTEEGTIQAFLKHMPRLKNMGVDILWIMPVHPIGEKNRKGPLGSYYSVKDYRAINPEFGSFDDFKAMVDLAHELGMKVIIDWVANHTAWDHAWVSEHPEYYDRDSTGRMYSPYGWSDVVQLDYQNTELRLAMIEEMKFWVKQADIDGFRCDVANEVPVDFWNSARDALNSLKPVFMLAEAENNDLLINAFDMDYGWHFHHLSNLIAKGDTSASVIGRYFDTLARTFPKGAYKMNFTTNHDENSWNGTTFERYGEGNQAFAVLMATVPGMPLVYTGQEAANHKALNFFDRDPVDWKDYPLEDFYRRLLNLKKRNQALWNGDFGGKMLPVKTGNDDKAFAFMREKNGQRVFVILNLSPDSLEVKLAGDAYTGKYTDLFTGKKVTFIADHSLALKPWEYRVYSK